MPDEQYDVFVSYRLQDQAFKNEVVRWLEAAGYTVAHRDNFSPTNDHVEQSKTLIRQCKVILFILHSAGFKNEQGEAGFQFKEVLAFEEARLLHPDGVRCFVGLLLQKKHNGSYAPTVETYPALLPSMRDASAVIHVPEGNSPEIWKSELRLKLSQHYERHKLAKVQQLSTSLPPTPRRRTRDGVSARPAEQPIVTPEMLMSRVVEANRKKVFGVNLMGGVSLDEDAQEGLILIKPGGTFYPLAMTAIFQRVLGRCRIAQMRLFDGKTIADNNFFERQYRPPTEIANGAIQLTEADHQAIKDIYDTPKFERKYGRPYHRDLVVPALELCDREGLSEDELTRHWDAGRERFNNRHFDGLNKIGYQKSVCPIRLDNSDVWIVVNGYIPGYRRLFTEKSARVVALHVRTGGEWASVRDDLVGGDSDPSKCNPGSIRYDTLQAVIKLDPNDKLVNGQRNVCHSSATLIDGVNELDIWFEAKPETSLLAAVCERNGIPREELTHIIGSQLQHYSWSGRYNVIDTMALDYHLPRIRAELKASAGTRLQIVSDYEGRWSLKPERMESAQSFQAFVDNGFRLAVAKRAFFQIMCARFLPEPDDRNLFYEVAGEIADLASRRDPEPSRPVEAEAYRIAANDIRYLNCPAYGSDIDRPQLFRTHVIKELAASALECAIRTENNVHKDLRAHDHRYEASAQKVARIVDTEAWKEFKQECAPTTTSADVVGLILCGGRSTRMASTIPKPCLPFRGRLMLNAVATMLKDAIPSGLDLFAAVGFRADLVKRAFDDGIAYLEYERTLGLGFRVATCLQQLGSHEGIVVLTYVDMPLISAHQVRDLIDAVKDHPNKFGLLVTTPASGLSGHTSRNEQGKVTRVTQERLEPRDVDQHGERDAGVYVFYNTSALREALLDIKDDNVRGEYMFADVIAELVSRGFEVVTVKEAAENAWGLNTSSDLLRVASGLENEQNRRPGINEIRSALQRDYGMKIDAGFDAALVKDAMRNHIGPFYFFHGWEKAWS